MTNSIEKISLRQANSCAPSDNYPHFMELEDSFCFVHTITPVETI
jgi:hypothetical protein